MAIGVNVETWHEFALPFTAVWNRTVGFNTLPDSHASAPESRLPRLSRGGAMMLMVLWERQLIHEPTFPI